MRGNIRAVPYVLLDIKHLCPKIWKLLPSNVRHCHLLSHKKQKPVPIAFAFIFLLFLSLYNAGVKKKLKISRKKKLVKRNSCIKNKLKILAPG